MQRSPFAYLQEAIDVLWGVFIQFSKLSSCPFNAVLNKVREVTKRAHGNLIGFGSGFVLTIRLSLARYNNLGVGFGSKGSSFE